MNPDIRFVLLSSPAWLVQERESGNRRRSDWPFKYAIIAHLESRLRKDIIGA